MTIDANKIEPYIIVPRYIVDDLRDRKITHAEFELYVWIRLQANPYGITTVSTDSIFADLPHLKSKDWISKNLRSLRKLKYIYYKERQGHRGSFRVEFGDWILPDKTIKQIDHLFGNEELRSENAEKADKSSEVGLNNVATTPKLEESKPESKSAFEGREDSPELRSPYTDTETHNDIETQRIVSNQKTFKGVGTRTFIPQNDHEERCWKIALELGDQYMDFILAILKKHGIRTINDAKLMYDQIRTENEHDGKPNKNPPALFNWCVQMTIGIDETMAEEKRKYGDDFGEDL